jgi:hypothetical protein
LVTSSPNCAAKGVASADELNLDHNRLLIVENRAKKE